MIASFEIRNIKVHDDVDGRTYTEVTLRTFDEVDSKFSRLKREGKFVTLEMEDEKTE